MRHYFEDYGTEANRFMNVLENNLGNPGNRTQAFIVLKAVLHTLRDRISIEENLDVLSQLPMALKGIYVDQWSYSENTDRYNTVEEFLEKVKSRQDSMGEDDFDWKLSTKEIVSYTLATLRGEYWTEGEWAHIVANLPEELKVYFEQEVTVST